MFKPQNRGYQNVHHQTSSVSLIFENCVSRVIMPCYSESPNFRWGISLPFSRSKNMSDKKPEEVVLQAEQRLLFNSEENGDIFFRNVELSPSPHGVTTQEILLCVVIAARTSNTTYLSRFPTCL